MCIRDSRRQGGAGQQPDAHAPAGPLGLSDFFHRSLLDPLRGLSLIHIYMGPEVRLINSGAEGARAAADCLRERDALAGPGRGSCRCFVSDRQEDFSRLASTFLGWDVAQAVEQVDISQY